MARVPIAGVGGEGAGAFVARRRTWGERIDAIRVNELAREHRGGRAVWIKRRRPGARGVAAVANVFFQAAGNPVRVLGERDDWLAWEVACHRLLHGDAFAARAEQGALVVEEVPGTDLSAALEGGWLGVEQMEAAGQELERVQAFASPALGGGWSHGDPHLGNFVYDGDEGRCRLIDFEVRHLASWGTVRRHADDYLVVLQDLCGRVGSDAWIDLGRALVGACGRGDVVEELKGRMRVPRGLGRIWWAVRTSYLARAELEARFERLRREL
jgi:hypothetical protein